MIHSHQQRGAEHFLSGNSQRATKIQDSFIHEKRLICRPLPSIRSKPGFSEDDG